MTITRLGGKWTLAWIQRSSLAHMKLASPPHCCSCYVCTICTRSTKTPHPQIRFSSRLFAHRYCRCICEPCCKQVRRWTFACIAAWICTRSPHYSLPRCVCAVSTLSVAMESRRIAHLLPRCQIRTVCGKISLLFASVSQKDMVSSRHTLRLARV